MTNLDLSIIVLYLLFITWRGFRSRGTYETTDDFFLAGRSLSWPLIGLSLYATNISITSIIGLSGSGYETGISVFNYEWSGTIMLLIFAVFIVPFYLKHKLTTMPEFLGKRFDERSRLYFSIISITMSVLIDIAGALFASSILLKGIFPEVELFVFVIIMAVVTGLYTVAGGLRAVVVTDSIQAILLTLGSAIVAVVAFQQIGSWEEVRSAVAPQFLSLIQPADDPFIPWPTLLISLPILGFYFMCSNQHMVQRVLGAKSLEDGRKGAIFAGLLKLPLLFILVLPGTLGLILYPEIENPNLVFPELMFDFIPAGVLGLILTGFIAALMSSIDSALTASSSIATMDIYKKFRPNSSQKQLIKMGKVFILAAVALASLWAPFINQFPTLWEYLQAVLSFLSPPIVTCYIFGLFWKRATADGAFYSLISGSVVAGIIIINNYFYTLFFPIHYLYSATIIFMVSNIILVAVSLKYPEKEISSFFDVDEGAIPPAEVPWYKSHKFFALMVLLITAAVVYIFW
ncbi:MAG: sodium transporter [Balneolaceae bacterium]|nr:MAG: sodium transporter [Balneolaceae bacterium]